MRIIALAAVLTLTAGAAAAADDVRCNDPFAAWTEKTQAQNPWAQMSELLAEDVEKLRDWYARQQPDDVRAGDSGVVFYGEDHPDVMIALAENGCLTLWQVMPSNYFYQVILGLR